MRPSAAAVPVFEGRRIAVITSDDSALPDVDRFLAPVFETHLLPTCDDIFPLLSQVPLDAIVLDLDGGEGPQANTDHLGNLRQISEDLVLVAMTRSHSRSWRAKALEAGCDEFVTPFDIRGLQGLLQRAIDKRATEIENRRLREQIAGRYSFCDLMGGSEAMQRVYDAILRVADSSTTVIIRGESGTGKELVARAIVACGERADKPFISVNCAALPENLIETELFGHEKGAFTDAHAARPGHIELAHTGTLFLDEIATLGLPLQSKLLRVLEDRAVTRIGGKTAKKIDFRLVTATNEDLEQMVREGRFREDLYYRIHVIPLFLPPLRERPGDIPLLVDHFLRLYCAANRMPMKRVEPEAMEILEEYNWPGNVRELENLVQRLVIMAEGAAVKVKHLPQQILATSAASHEQMLIPEEGIDFDEEMQRIEVAYLQAALRRTGGHKAEAARLLRLDARRMGYLCQKYQLGDKKLS